MHVLLRRKGFGLDTLRKIRMVMGRDDVVIRNNISVRTMIVRDDPVAINWGYVDSCPIGFSQLNRPNDVGIVSNKSLFRKKLYENNLAMYTTTDFNNAKEWLINNNGKKLIVRPRNHYGGIRLYCVNNVQELRNAVLECGSGWYASEYISKSKEFRVFVAQGRVVWVAEKVVDDISAIAWNHEQGSVFNNVRFGDWNKKVIKHALEAMKLTHLDFGAVDVLVSLEGVEHVLEINTAPSIDSEYRISKTAQVFNYMLENPEKRFDEFYINEDLATLSWRNFIHPAVNPEDVDTVLPVIPFEPYYYIEKVFVGQKKAVKVYYKDTPNSEVLKLTYYGHSTFYCGSKITLQEFNHCLELAKEGYDE